MASNTLDWSALSSLRLRARAVSDGLFSGAHRSLRKGSGVEFGGFRPYVLGDDLRFMDRRAMLRFDRPMIREFQSETDRSVRVLVDASESMSYRGKRAKVTKYEFASTLAAALTRIALVSGDPVHIEFVGGTGPNGVRATSTGDGLARVIYALEQTTPSGDISSDLRTFEQSLVTLSRDARRGAIMVFFSDLLDLADGSEDEFCSLAGRGRTLIVCQVLDPDETDLGFDDPTRFMSIEGKKLEIETDPPAVRKTYLEKLNALQNTWEQRLMGHGGGLIKTATDQDPVQTLRELLLVASRGAR